MKPSKADKRRLKKALREQQQKEKSIRLSGTVPAKSKTVRGDSDNNSPPKLVRVKSGASVNINKTPRKKDEEGFYGCEMSWCHSNADTAGQWSWNEQRIWSEDEWANDIAGNLDTLEGETWSYIMNNFKVRTKTEKEVPKHHHQEVSTLSREAKRRWIEHGLEHYDTAFRFRCSGKKRIWGVRLQGHFYLVWYERKHKIYPVGL